MLFRSGYDPTEDILIQRVVPFIRMSTKRTRQRRAQVEVMTDKWLEDLRKGNKELTKRRVLAFVMSQYDPLGLLAPILLEAKLQLCALYGSSYQGGWDDELPEGMAAKWHSVITEALEHEGYPVPRAVLREGATGLHLIAFWDGSLDAHAACLYLRSEWTNQDGGKGTDVHLVYAKSRVAPISGTTKIGRAHV